MPWVIGMIAMGCLIVITCSIIEMFSINNPVFIVGTDAVLSANTTKTELLQSFFGKISFSATARILYRRSFLTERFHFIQEFMTICMKLMDTNII